MPMSRAVAIACLTVLKYLLWVMGGLLVILAIKQWASGADGGPPLQPLLLGAASIVGGWVSGYVASRFERGS